MEEIEIIQVALENLEKNTLIKGRYKNTGIKELDGQLELVINGRTIKLNLEIKKELRNYQLNQVIDQNTKFGPLIIAANNIFPNLKQELRTHNIAYLDSKGNLYLNQDDIYVWLEANKSVIPEKEKVNRAFTKTGLKVLFHILLFEDTVQIPYRIIAQQTKVGLGNINYVMNGLKEMGFLIKLNDKQYKLRKKNELLQKWVIAYGERLKPTLHMGTFRFLKNEDFNNWKQLPVGHGGTWWGSEPAADLFTNHLQPEELTIYTIETRSELIKRLRLIPDENGNVKVYQKFWNYDHENDNVVPPILIYADLINTQESRCIETANKIYDLVLKDEFERN
jgi:hypothetical protein